MEERPDPAQDGSSAARRGLGVQPPSLPALLLPPGLVPSSAPSQAADGSRRRKLGEVSLFWCLSINVTEIGVYGRVCACVCAFSKQPSLKRLHPHLGC